MRRAGFNCTTSQAGNSLEIYVEHWLAQRFPAEAISHKQLLHIPSLGHFECDLLISPPVRTPLRPRYYIIECKNYRRALPHHYLTELWFRATCSEAEGGWLFLWGSLSPRSLTIATFLGLRVMVFCPLMHSFIQVSP